MVCKSNSKSIVRRPTTRGAMCRGCDEHIAVGEDMVYTYSSRGNGGGIPICLECARLIGKLASANYLRFIVDEMSE